MLGSLEPAGAVLCGLSQMEGRLSATWWVWVKIGVPWDCDISAGLPDLGGITEASFWLMIETGFFSSFLSFFFYFFNRRREYWSQANPSLIWARWMLKIFYEPQDRNFGLKELADQRT